MRFRLVLAPLLPCDGEDESKQGVFGLVRLAWHHAPRRVCVASTASAKGRMIDEREVVQPESRKAVTMERGN